ncbi:DUF3800 domain-containing protein [Kribbella sp. NPDC051770]|uniref:DUF3800 domain-containing protein n=1 Tax=Kribbella sp. NPDC051770 TaxID=3155413 RepID=UPI003434D009
MSVEPVWSGLVEVACDESGFSGTNLLDPDTRVFTHASVRIGPGEARRAVEELRERSRFVAGEYKSARLFKQRPALTWLLGPEGPLLGRSAVQLTDKYYLLSGRLTALFTNGFDYRTGTSLDPHDPATALALHRRGPAHGDIWWTLLQSFIDLLRSKNRTMYDERTDDFLAVAAEFTPLEPGLRISRAPLEALRDRLFDDRTLLPPLEVLIPALVETTQYWYADGNAISMVHDEQSALTPYRIDQVDLLMDHAPLDFRQTDSRTDPRVQLADLLAGSARQIATAELNGQGDPALTALLRPYLTPHPIWADAASWARLRPL